MEPIIRKRKVEDSEELAHCISLVWDTTYRGIIDDDFINHLKENEKERALHLKQNIRDDEDYYVLTLQDKIIGWLYYTLDSDKYENAAEIHTLYILKEYQGQGYGKLLYNYALENIRKKGIKNLVIGCLDGNNANEFYKHMGGEYIGTGLFKDKYKENIYLFKL